MAKPSSKRRCLLCKRCFEVSGFKGKARPIPVDGKPGYYWTGLGVPEKQVPLNAGSRGMARDPAEIYEANERRSCAGCSHVTFIHLAGTPLPACEKGKTYGRRCKAYDERQPIRSTR